jgi:hypothetical protein
MNLTRRVTSGTLIILGIVCAALALAQQNQNTKTLAIGPQAEIRFSAPWQPSAVKYSNAQELVARRTEPSTPGVTAAESGEPLARMLITTEPRTSHTDALERLEAIAASRNARAEFVEIGGWPAVEIKFTELLPRTGAKGEKEGKTPMADVTVQRTITAIAQDDKVVVMDTTVLPSAPQALVNNAKEITRSVRFPKKADPNAVKKELETIRQKEKERQLQKPQSSLPNTGPAAKSPAVTKASPAKSRAAAAAAAPSNAGAAVRVQGGKGELEITSSADANTVIIASNSGLSFSTNRGASFSAGTTGVFGLNDPSVGRGVSGNFYLDVIAFPSGTAEQLNVRGCTNAVSRSTNNGAAFTLQGYNTVCPTSGTGICFPDQEHLAVDASNAAGNDDQLYAVWRNFTPAGAATSCNFGSGFVTASISCSQNNGTDWTKRAAISGTSDFPRVAVGRDGSVYVVSLGGNSVLLNRFSSCATNLTPAAGFPITVATLSGPVGCPVPGLDRCNDGNTLSSPVVAPDPGDANHLFVTFAENNGSNAERIVAMESTDRGTSFPTRTNVSNSSSVRRFMPWSCTTRGRAWVGWYDRFAATAANNDLTDYFLGSSVGGMPLNLSGRSDPECASGFQCGARSMNDWTSCSGGCPTGLTCNTGSGCPKYGDYNGIACAEDFILTAWTSATAPAGLPPVSGLNIFSSVVSLQRTFDRVAIVLKTGNDNAGSGVEITGHLSGQSASFCLKPSTDLAPDEICPNGPGAKDQNRKDTWDNWSVNSLNFALDTLQTSAAGFGTITITMRQTGCSTFCDNWDIQGITVTAIDSTGTLPPVTLVNMSNPNNGDNCIARLKGPPNATTVRFGLDGTKSHVYVDGTGAEQGETTTCKNNGD